MSDRGSVEPSAKRKASRWSDQKAFVPGMPTVIPPGMDDTSTQIYLLQLETEELTRRLRTHEYENPDGTRSPSPEPVYDSNGRRTNTRTTRKRLELENRRHDKIQALLKLNPEYKPPAEYRTPSYSFCHRVYIPQDSRPHINFIGLLLGPRGNTLKAMQMETNTRIIIRGRGSVREGKLPRSTQGDSEPLHAFICGANNEDIRAAAKLIEKIIGDAMTAPNDNFDFRQNQLKELAVLNGTARKGEISLRCSNCGSKKHKTYECLEVLNVTANIVCDHCHCSGHLTRDCIVAPSEDKDCDQTIEESSTSVAEEPQKSATEEIKTITIDELKSILIEEPETATTTTTATTEQPKASTAEEPKAATTEESMASTAEKPNASVGGKTRKATVEEMEKEYRALMYELGYVTHNTKRNRRRRANRRIKLSAQPGHPDNRGGRRTVNPIQQAAFNLAMVHHQQWTSYLMTLAPMQATPLNEVSNFVAAMLPPPPPPPPPAE